MMKRNKTKTILLIILLSVICFLLLEIMIMFLLGKSFFNAFSLGNYKVSNQIQYEEVYNHLSEIDVSLLLGDVSVLPSSDNQVHVMIYSDQKRFVVDDEGSVLNIQFEEEEGFQFDFSRVGERIEIYIPKDSDISFEIDVDQGDVEISKFMNGSFDVTNDMGNVDVSGASVLDVDCDMGDVSVGEIGKLKAKLDLGDLEVETITEEIDINCDIGNVSIDDVRLTKDSTITLSLGDVTINHILDVYVDAKNDLGDIDIKKQDRTANVTLTIKNDMGDISLG